jgi:hypothetical protein
VARALRSRTCAAGLLGDTLTGFQNGFLVATIAAVVAGPLTPGRRVESR